MEICAGCADIPDDEPDPDERRAVCFYPEYDAPDQRKGETDVSPMSRLGTGMMRRKQRSF